MITDPPPAEPAGTSRRWSDLLRVMTARPRRAGLGEHMRTLSIGGRIVRVAVREGNPDWPPLPLCNGIRHRRQEPRLTQRDYRYRGFQLGPFGT